MIVALSGTPGTGKTSVSALLKKQGYKIFSLNKIALDKNFIEGIDKKRNSKILDMGRINEYIKKKYCSEDLVFIEGHAAHFLSIAEKVIILRCHPKKLKKRLEKKGWGKEKIKENVEAEALDVILCETVDIHSEKNVFEIDATDRQPQEVGRDVKHIMGGKVKNYKIGKIDWSEEVLK